MLLGARRPKRESAEMIDFILQARKALISSLITPLLCAGASAQSGPVSIEGQVTSDSFIFQPTYWPNPTVALIDISDVIAGRFDRFVPAEDQILGRFTDPLFAGEGRYQHLRHGSGKRPNA